MLQYKVMAVNEITIKSLEEFLAAISELEGLDMVFRGQSDAAWAVESTAYRRLKKPSSDKLLKYNQYLIAKARRYRGREFEEPISDLQLLAKLRHHNAATMLIDFTQSAIAALWFACEENKDTNGKKTDGKVFCSDTGANYRFSEIKPEDEKQKSLATILKSLEKTTAKTAKWEPPLDNRVLKQDSFFILDKEGKLENDVFEKVITIDEDSKVKILAQLKESYNLSEETIFPDFYGFAQNNNFRKPYGPQTATDIFKIALIHHRHLNHEEAIELYGEAIKLNSNLVSAYNNRADLKIAFLSRYEEAIADYDEAIKRAPEWIGLYISRGNAKFELKRYEEAIADYDESIKVDPEWFMAYLDRGNAKFELKRYEEAIADYDEAIKLEPEWDGAYINRGIAKFNLKRYKEAIADYDEAIRLDSTNEKAHSARGLAKQKLGLNEEMKRDFERAIEIKREREQRLSSRDNTEDIPF